jgi:peptidyl-prolyl cis-trans isomerase C
LGKPLRRALFSAVLALTIAGCSAPPRDLLARSALGDVTSQDLEAYVLSLPEPRRRPVPGEEPKAWRHALLEEMLVERALDDEGRKAGVLDRPEAQAWLRSQIESLLVEEVRARCIAQRVKVTDAQVRDFYDSHPAEVGHDEQIRLRHIFHRVPREAPPAVRDKARREMGEILAQLRAGASFEETARTRSESDTASGGGLIGRLNRGDLSPSLEAVVWRLKEGELSDVVATPVGFHVFKLDGHIPPFKMDFEEARERLRKRLTQEAVERSLRQQADELLASLGASYRPDNLLSTDPAALVFALGDFRMTRADWQRELAAKPFAAQRGRPEREILDETVGDRLRLAEARRSKLEEEPALRRRVEELEEKARVRLAREERLRATTSAAELREFYASHRERFGEPRLVRLRLVTLGFPEDKPDYAVFERLQELSAEVRSGRRDLADAARSVSTDLSAPRGGDLGFIRLDALGEWAGPKAYSQVEKLTPGELSEPILLERYDSSLLRYHRVGYMLVRVEEVREARVRPFEEVEARVREALTAERRAEIRRRVDREVLASVHAQVYDRNL